MSGGVAPDCVLKWFGDADIGSDVLAIFVALLDLIPFESAVAGVLGAVVALTVSIQESLAPLGF